MSVLDYGTWSWSLCPWSCVFVGWSISAVGLRSVYEFVHHEDLHVLVDCKFTSCSWATRAQALKMGLKSSKMRQADCHCTISNHMDFRFCWWRFHTTDAYSNTGFVCLGNGCLASLLVHVYKVAHFVGFCSGWPDVFFPANVLCQLQFRVLSADNSLAVLFLAVVAGGDPVPFPCYMLRVLKCWKVRHYTEEEEHTRTYWLLIHLTSDFWSLDGDISHR